nr:MAG TPA: hypothetical protein [Caudoviricetes sp.]
MIKLNSFTLWYEIKRSSIIPQTNTYDYEDY